MQYSGKQARCKSVPIVSSHLYESEGVVNKSVVLTERIMSISWKILTGKGQERAFQSVGNFLYLDLCDCTEVGICKIS